MNEANQLASLFDSHRSHLRGMAFRMLGSLSDADDAVQEAWLRLNRSDADEIENLKRWLTTVVARVCLDMLRSRKAHHEEPLDSQVIQPTTSNGAQTTPEEEAVIADSIGLALLVMLDTLAPAERVAFVLHDVIDVPFDEIARIVGRSPEAVRQLASRARRRVRGAEKIPDSEIKAQRAVVEAFVAALRAGDFEGLVAVLDPDVVFRADAAAGVSGSPTEIRGARKWARGAIAFSGFAQYAQPALVNGAVGLLLAPGGRLSRVVTFGIAEGKINQVEVIAEPDRLQQINLAVLNDWVCINDERRLH